MSSMETLIDVASKLLADVAVPLLVAWVSLVVRKKYKVDIAEADERRLREFAREGVAWAEEQARKAVKSNAPLPMPAEKLKMAKDFVQRRAGAARIGGVKVTLPALHDLVEAELARNRTGLSGLTPPPEKDEPN